MPSFPRTVGKARAVRKRLFVFCDGTWQDGVNKTRPLTNVATLARCLEGVADDGYLQISYYDSGVGNMTSFSDQLIGGATGRGITAKIRNAYSFLSHNYSFGESDEIILVGFSRGAFAVQCLASFISQTGLLHKPNLYYLHGLFTLWANQDLEPSQRHRSQQTLATYVRGFEDDGVLSKVKIKACVVWDTVSSLKPLRPWIRPFAFVGSVIPGAVENAFQALALNEARLHFKPSIWTRKESPETYAKQCWFLGSHSDVGGNGDAALGAVTLVWVVGQLLARCKAKFNQNEIAKHLKHRLLEWRIGKVLPLGQLQQTLTLSYRLSSGQTTKPLPLWWFLGLEPRKFEARVYHLNAKYDVQISVHFTVRLSMFQDPKSCRLLKKWETMSENGHVYWQLDEKTPIEDRIEEDYINCYEQETLKAWADGEYSNLETERARFAGRMQDSMHMPPVETDGGVGQFAAFLRESMVFEDGCLVPEPMYKPKRGCIVGTKCF